MADLTLNDLICKYSGNHICLYFSEFQYQNAEVYAPVISISGDTDGFNMKDFLLENPLGVMPVVDFHGYKSVLKILLHSEDYCEDKEEDQND